MSISKVGNAYVCYQSIDKDRVEAVQALLDGLEIFSYLRIGQFICNARLNHQETECLDNEFYITDEELAMVLKAYTEEMKPRLVLGDRRKV